MARTLLAQDADAVAQRTNAFAELVTDNCQTGLAKSGLAQVVLF